MPKFPENKGFKMPGLGSKEKHTPGNFREEHQVDKMGYCDDTPINMLPPGSSPATFMGNEPLASSSDGSPLTYQWSLDDDPYTSVKYTPGSLDFSDAIRPKTEKNPEGNQDNTNDGNINMPEYKPKLPEVPSFTSLTGKGKKGGIAEQDRIEIEIGDGNYQGGGTFENQGQRDWYDDQIKKRIKKGMSKEEAIQDYRNTFKIGKQNKDIAVITGEKGKFKRIK